jgi:peptide/nickel transport system ATP-binding protein
MNALNPVFKVGDQIMDVIQFHEGVSKSEARRKTEGLFDKVGLSRDRINNYPFEFSGGMKQRAIIALALSCDPTLLIADEPTTALDVTIQAQILELIGDIIRERDSSFMLITHDLSVISETCDKIAVMYAGRIVEYGTVESVYLTPIHPYTKGLIDAIPSMEKGKSKRLTSIPGEPPDLLQAFEACNFHFRCPYAKPVCREESPEPRYVDGRWVECHFAEEVIDISGVDLYQRTVLEYSYPERIREPILEITDLRKLFQVRSGFMSSFMGQQIFLKAVDGVSFDINRGEIFGLVGESGCGKTTTGKCLVKLIEPSEGSILLDGSDITRMKKSEFKAERRKIQILFQDPYITLDPRQNIYNAVAEPIRIHGLAKDRVEEQRKVTDLLDMLKLVPPEDYMQKFPHQLSGGERQRVSLARVMALNPEVIIADEPVSMLDVSIRAGVLDNLLQLREIHNVSIMLITHDLAVASYMSDRLGVMYLGKLVEIGIAEDIVDNPLHPYTQALIASVPSPDPLREKRKAEIIGEPPSPISPPTGCKFNPRCPNVMSICSKEEPQLLEQEDKRKVACFLYQN